MLPVNNLPGQDQEKPKKAGFVKAGISLIIGGAETSDDLTFIPALTVIPGIRVLHAPEASIYLESPVSIGLGVNDNKSSFGFELPFIANVGFGYGSSNLSNSRFGWSAGIGKAYHFSHNEYYFYGDLTENHQLTLWGTVLQTCFYLRGKYKGDSGGMIRFHWISNFSNTPVRKDVIGIGLIAVLD